MTKVQDFLFTVVMPVYNTAEFLAESIESIVGQSIGFEDNIQLVLVNDGSTDNSAEVCQHYRQLYPDNVLYLEQENAGVSAARNAGLSKATGRYVNFLDSDDKWSSGAFKQFADFLKKNPSVNIATAKHEFFGAKTGEHPLAYKYQEDRVIDIFEVVDCPHLSLSNAVVALSLFEGISFDPSLKVSEDFLVFNKILMGERKFALLSKPTYWYRKRADESSAIDTSRSNKSWYIDTPKLCYKALFDLSEERFGCVIPYVQYAVMYDLQWRLKASFKTPLDAEGLAEYKAICLDLLSRIDPAVICAQRNLSRAQKLAILALRDGAGYDEATQHLVLMKSKMCLPVGAGQSRGSLVDLWGANLEASIRLHFMRLNKDSIEIEGSLLTELPLDKIEINVLSGKKKLAAQLFERVDSEVDTFFEGCCRARVGFTAVIPKSDFSFECRIMGTSIAAKLKTMATFPLSDRKNSYYWEKGTSVTRSGDKFVVRNRNRSWRLKREHLYSAAIKDRQISKLRKATVFDEVLGKKGGLWLISDRPHMAGDNGEALFSYLQANPVPGVKTIFCLETDSPDYSRLSKIGPVVPYWSDEHKRLLLRADKNISSAADVFVHNPFGEQYDLVKDLLKADFVFLQHGVTKDDMSAWLKRWNKDIKLLCCASGRERDSIIDNPKYGYDASVAKLTGFARHDRLIKAERRPSKKILLAPTWRKYLAGELEEASGKYSRNPDFVKSEYFVFYDRLLNDEDIAEAAATSGFEVHFLLHPAFIENLGDFKSSYAQIQTEYKYAEEFLDSAIMVTDYSSVAFDFAILKKPLFYAQFDKEKFYETQWERGYFDYDEDGFGPVCSTYEETKDLLICLMNEPVMDELYRSRVDSFFGPLDGRACERIVDALTGA